VSTHDGEEPEEGRILSVHLGPSANCSSIGSHIDFLFISATVSGAMLSALAVAMTRRASDDTPSEPGDAAVDRAAPKASEDEDVR
jgi:hypothetical protein